LLQQHHSRMGDRLGARDGDHIRRAPDLVPRL